MLIFLNVINPTNLTNLRDLTSDFRENSIVANRNQLLLKFKEKKISTPDAGRCPCRYKLNPCIERHIHSNIYSKTRKPRTYRLAPSKILVYQILVHMQVL